MRFALCFVAVCLVALAQDASAIKPLHLQVSAPEGIRDGAMFPFLWKLQDGSALLEVSKGTRTYRRPGGFEYQQQDPAFLVSRDGLKSWQPWEATSSVKELPWFEGSALQLRDGRVLMFEYIAHKVAHGEYEGRVWQSSAHWKNFSGPVPFRLSLPQYEEKGASDQGTPFLAVPWHRSVLEMPDGSLLAAIYGRFQGDNIPAEYNPALSRMRSFIVKSHDEGKTWSYVSTIASAPVEQEGFGEPSVVRLSQGPHVGRLICIMRTGRINPLYESESDDNGRTWSKAHPLRWMFSRYGHWREIVGTDPDVIEMRDGTLALSFGHKSDYEDDGDFVAFSVDHGGSWTQVTRLSMEKTCAYTSIVEVDDGTLYVVYSAGGASTEAVPAGVDRTRLFRVLGQSIHVSR